MILIDKVRRNLELLRGSLRDARPYSQIPPALIGEVLPIEEWETFASKIPEQETPKIRIKRKLMPKGKTLDMGDVFGYEQVIFLRDVWITVLEEYGYIEPCKWQVWMSDSPMEYYAMWELNARIKPSRILIGGLGLGILTNIVANRKDITRLTVVELSPTIIEMIKPYIPTWVEIVNDNFIDYFRRAWQNRVQFDTIIVDIFSGNRFKDKPLLEDVQMEAEDYTFDFPDTRVLYWKYQRDKETELITSWMILEEKKR